MKNIVKATSQQQSHPRKTHNLSYVLTVGRMIAVPLAVLARRFRIHRAMRPLNESMRQQLRAIPTKRDLLTSNCLHVKTGYLSRFFPRRNMLTLTVETNKSSQSLKVMPERRIPSPISLVPTRSIENRKRATRPQWRGRRGRYKRLKHMAHFLPESPESLLIRQQTSKSHAKRGHLCL